MKRIFRLLPVAAMLALLTPSVVEAAAPSRAALASPTNIVDTKVKIAVRNYAESLGLSRGGLTYVYDSDTDFRVYQGTNLIEYGYYDAVDDAVYIGGVDYTH